MNSFRFTRLGIALVAATLAAAPSIASAYLSPQQVFGGAGVTLQPAPPQPREGDAVVQEQQQRSAEFRSSAQSQLNPTYTEPQDNYKPSAEPLGLFDPNTQYEIRQERISEQKATGGNSPTIILGAQGTVIDGNGNVLHSGAPHVTSTGPETIMAGIALLLAAVSTVIYAEIRAKKQTLLH